MADDFSRLRLARPADAPALLAIYAPYVEQTAITFEYDVPPAEEFARRIEDTLKKYPYLVAEEGGQPVGYAYAGPFHARPAYDWAVETSIYVLGGRRGGGLGRLLYEGLETALREQGILNLNACVACPGPAGEDEYLTDNSVRFHQHMGYRLVGRFEQCGYKFGRWYNMAWLEKHIGPHLAEQPPVGDMAWLRQRLGEKYGLA